MSGGTAKPTPKPIIGKGGKFLWTRRQVLEVLDAQRQEFEAVVDEQRNNITGLLAELDEARNVVRSVVRTAGQLDSVLTGWLASKDPKVEEVAPAADTGGEAAPTMFDEAAPYPSAETLAAARKAAEKVLETVTGFEANIGGDEQTDPAPMFLQFYEDTHHATLSEARVLAVVTPGASLTYRLDGGDPCVWHAPKDGDLFDLIVYRNEHRRRILEAEAVLIRDDGTVDRTTARLEVLPYPGL